MTEVDPPIRRPADGKVGAEEQALRQALAAKPPAPPGTRRRSPLRVIVLLCLLLAGVVGANHFQLNRHAQQALKSTSVDVLAYYRYGVLPDTIVYDLRDVGGTASTAEIMGNFMRFAEALKDRRFSEIHLAWRGETRFVLGGRDFRTIGAELSWQNPIYTLRTFPEKLKTPQGLSAFSSWSGGMLGVTAAQMEDLNRMAERWFLKDLRY